MIFKPVLVRKVRDREKTVTRRKVKSAGEVCRYSVGRTYAVQAGRGKPEVARIRVVSVHQERIDQVTTREARLEGFHDRSAFVGYWQALHGGDWNPHLLVWRIEFVLVAAINVVSPEPPFIADLPEPPFTHGELAA